jgi:AraC family transcriptional regulator
MSDGSPIFAAGAVVDLSPAHILNRQTEKWRGLQVEIFEATQREPFQYKYSGDRHLLIAAETASRQDGETYVEGLPKSTLREFSGKLTLIPAGHKFCGWLKPRRLWRSVYFYIDPKSPVLAQEARFAEIKLKPRLFFTDSDLWETAYKLKRLVERPAEALYAEALEVVLAHELLRSDSPAAAHGIAKGGLAAWQKKRVAEYIEEHLAEDILLSTLAQIAGLSPYHFARAFKESFGVPPHRYHMLKRIERAKALLSKPSVSVTEAGLRTGFSGTSAFSAAFRKITLQSPSQYRRSLG